LTPKRRIIPVFVPHLGCPHQCVFCNQRRISGAQSPATGKTVREALEKGLAGIPAGPDVCLAFYGGSFTAIPAGEQEELLGAALPFLRSGALASVRVSTRPDCVDGAALGRLARFGVKTVELGVQSMCPEVLRASKRGHTPEDAARAAALVRAAGFELVLQMMTGLPEDTPERSMETARRLIAMKPDGVRIYPTVVVKDTELYDLWRAGLYREHTVEDAVALCARLAELFGAAGIPVIRMGLNPTEELSAGGAAAGAYHPAFGELVRSRLYLAREAALLSDADRGKDVTLLVGRGRVSEAVGQRRCNVLALTERFGLRSLRVREGGAAEMEVLRAD